MFTWQQMMTDRVRGLIIIIISRLVKFTEITIHAYIQLFIQIEEWTKSIISLGTVYGHRDDMTRENACVCPRLV